MRMIIRRLGAERGFTMIVTLGALMLGSLLMVAGFTAVNGNIGLTNNDANQKDAYAAAQAGVADYIFHLTQDNNYWTYCTAVPTPTALNDPPLTGSSNYRTVFGSRNEKYAIELMPANGLPKCDPANAASMITTSGVGAGSFRIRSTGFAGNVQRSIVAAFRRPSFLDYVYFTNYETLDPVSYATQGTAATQCAKYWRNGRESVAYTGSTYCTIIDFTTGDSVNGPMHTNDQFAVCGSPIFGRGPGDFIETSAPAPGHSVLTSPNQGSCGSDNTVMKGIPSPSSAILTAPPSNVALSSIVQPTFHFTGTVYIVLNGNNMTVNGPPPSNTLLYSGLAPNAAPGGNGVLYVSNASCSTTYTPFHVVYPPAGSSTGCGTAFVHGTYSSSLTIATENDIVIDGNITRVGDTLLGLIPNNFIRLYHPCVYGSGGGTGNQAGSLTSPSLDVAMLSLLHSFIVDNYDCGAQLGTLAINGTVAQNFRGPVGQTGTSGYLKNYGYDDRLRYEEPPHFIDPVQAQWKVQRETECAGNTVNQC